MRTREQASNWNGNGTEIDPFDQQDFSDFLESMAGEAGSYWKAEKDYYTLVASERAARLSASLLSMAVLCLVATSVLGLVSTAAALWIGRLVDDLALGFLIIGGAYLLLGAIFLVLWRTRSRDRFILRIFNSIYHG